MGGGQSTGRSPAPNGRVIAPAPRSDLSIGFSGDMNRQVNQFGGPVSGTAPPGLTVGGFRGIFRLREVHPDELQDGRYGWRRMSNAIPVYVEVPDMGVSVTEYYRYVGGMLYYVVYKVHPLNPELDLNISKRYEVPFMAGKRQIIWPMEVAVTGLWPSKDAVFLVNNRGEQFRMDFHELLQVQDQKIRIAVGALKKDYPNQLTSALSFRPVSTPKFKMYGQKDATAGPQTFTTLSGSRQADALYAALNQQLQCTRAPERRQKVAPPMQMPLIPVCVDNGIPSVFDTGVSTTGGTAGGSGGFGGQGFTVPPVLVSKEDSKEGSKASSKIGAEFGGAAGNGFFEKFNMLIGQEAQENAADTPMNQFFKNLGSLIGVEAHESIRRLPQEMPINEEVHGRLNTAEYADACMKEFAHEEQAYTEKVKDARLGVAAFHDEDKGTEFLHRAMQHASPLLGELLDQGEEVMKVGASLANNIVERGSTAVYAF